MTVFETLQTLGLPIVYGAHTEKIQTPYLLITGDGQQQAVADDTYFWTEELFSLEYYFTDKDPETEARIEAMLLDMGRLYEKSEDLYLDDQKVFMIYYNF